MLTLYVVWLVVGGVLLAMSLLVGDAADGLAAGSGLAAGELGAGSEGEGVTAAARFLSVRNLVFFAAFFGLTGDAAPEPPPRHAGGGGRLRGGRGERDRPPDALPAAQRVGSRSGRHGSLEGAPVRVVVDVARERAGKVAVTCGDRSHQLVARIHREAGATRLRAGEPVLVVRMANGVAWIAESTFLA